VGILGLEAETSTSKTAEILSDANICFFANNWRCMFLYSHRRRWIFAEHSARDSLRFDSFGKPPRPRCERMLRDFLTCAAIPPAVVQGGE